MRGSERLRTRPARGLFASFVVSVLFSASVGGCPGPIYPDDEPDSPTGDGSINGGEGGGQPEGGATGCDTGLTKCGDRCVETDTDTNHCGRCNHGCLGGSCTKGACQPIQLAGGYSSPRQVALSKNDVYASLPYQDRIVRVPKGGGPAVDVVSGVDADGVEAIGLVLDDAGEATSLYWGTGFTSVSATLRYCTLPACAPITTISASNQVQAIAFTATQAFWTESAISEGKVRRCSLSSCSGTAFDVNSTEPGASGITVASNVLFFTRNVSAGSVRRSTPGGGGLADLIPALDRPDGVASDGANVYAAVGGAALIAKCPLIGCTGPSTFALGTNPHDVATDGTNVYWTNGLATGGSVAWCPSAGCGPEGARVLAKDQGNPFGIRADESAVYWVNSVNNGGVMKIAKP